MREVLATRGDLHSELALNLDMTLVEDALHGLDVGFGFEDGPGTLEQPAFFRDLAQRLAFGTLCNTFFSFRCGAKELREFCVRGQVIFAAVPLLQSIFLLP